MTGPVRPLTGAPAGIPGQGGQQPPHPTIGYLGQGPVPQQTVVPQQPQMNQQMAAMMQQADPNRTIPQGLPPQPQQQPQQHATVPFNPQPPQGQFQQQYPQQPQPQYQQPQAQPQTVQGQPVQFQTPQGQRFDMPDNAILDGPNVPPELRGRTWGQARQIYTALATNYMAGRQQSQVQSQPEPQAQQPQPQAGRPNGPRSGGGDFWTDPEGTIARVVDQRISTHMAPVVQQSAQTQAEQAMRVAQAGISDWQQLYPEVLTVISESGAQVQHLGDPRVWQQAADLARGRLAGRGQYQPNGMVPAPQQQTRGPGAYVPAQVAPPIGQMFTEAPTPPQNQFGQPGNLAMTPEEEYYQRQSGLDRDTWIQWRNAIRVQR